MLSGFTLKPPELKLRTLIKCFIILIVLGIFLPKFVDYSLERLINDTKIYKNSVMVYKLVDIIRLK